MAAFIKDVESTPFAKEHGIAPILGNLSFKKLYLGATEGEEIPAGDEAEVARASMTILFNKGWPKYGSGDNWCFYETHDAPNLSFSSYRSDDINYSKQLEQENPGPSS